jgi:FAD:protein FMN transferase
MLPEGDRGLVRGSGAGVSRRRIVTILAGAAGLPLLAVGDQRQSATRLYRWQGTALGSPSRILVCHTDRGVAERALARSVAEIERLEKVFSLYRRDSEIVRLNREGHLEAPSQDFLTLLSHSQRFAELSGGGFDVTVQPLWDVYAAHFFKLSAPSLAGPEPQAIEAALALVDWQKVDVTSRRVVLARRGMAVTLNGIAQGYLTDRIADILRAEGCGRVLADMGRSEIRLLGLRPDGRPWRIGLADPRAPDRIAVALELADRCISTSGGYGTKFEASGRHHHLFDPATGRSAGHYIAVSVVAERTMTADALSTALYVTPPERSLALLAAFPSAEVIVTRPDGLRRKLGARRTVGDARSCAAGARPQSDDCHE